MKRLLKCRLLSASNGGAVGEVGFQTNDSSVRSLFRCQYSEKLCFISQADFTELWLSQ